jgi:DNA-binding transcriptional MocR family regulator
MIEMQYNFPLLAGQVAQWKERLLAAVRELETEDANELRPTFRGDQTTLREVAAWWLGSPEERTWIVCGGNHGTLTSLLTAGLAGKPIAVERVTYTGILEQAAMLASPLVGLEYDAEGMLPDALRAACANGALAAIYAMPTVHNPLGCTASLARREEIVAVAREFGLVIVEDDAYGFMEPQAPPSYAVLAPERTFYVRGLSKCYAPATRTGLLVVPEEFNGKVETVLKNTTSGTALVHNVAAMSLVADGSIEEVMLNKREEGARRNAAARAVLGAAAAPGAESAWHLWVSLPEGMTSAAAQKACEEGGVLVSGAGGFVVPGCEAPAALRVALGGEVEAARTAEGVAVLAEVMFR